MTRLKATKPFRYAGRMLRAGEEFDARGNQDARLLTAIGKAERIADAAATPATPSGKRRGRPPKVREEVAAVESASEPEVREARDRLYRRRDMEAEGSE
jgi:hypothetical protein